MLTDPKRLGKKAHKIIENGENQLFWSAASFWELTVKVSLGKLTLQNNWIETIEQEKKRLRIRDLPILWQHCEHQLQLPWHHRDPFDRLLICQALTEDATLITKDTHIQQYRVKTLW